MAQYETEKIWRTTKRGHVSKYLNAAKNRAKNQNLPFDLDLDFLMSIALDECPVFKTPFIWGQSKGKHPYRPSLDRVVPRLGYVKHNVVFISLKANTIKQDVTEKELYAVADWLHKARKNVKQNTTTPVSEGTYSQGDLNTQPGTVSLPRVGEIGDSTDDHSGAVRGQDADHSTEEGSGDGVGRGSKEVGTFVTSYDIQNNGQPKPKISSIKFGGRHLFS